MTDTRDMSPLLLALYRGDTDEVARLRHVGPLDASEAAALGDTARLRDLVAADATLVTSRSPDGFPLVALAAYFGHEEAVDLLLERGADPNAAAGNAMRVTALHAAIAGRHADIALMLLGRGADPNVRQEGGWTPLHQAADHGDSALVRALLDAGAHPVALNDDGRTPLTMAEAGGHTEAASMLAAS